MAIAPALLATQCFMLAICPTGLDHLPPMNPWLSTRPTQDITVTCQLAAFMDTHRSFDPDLLQVVWNCTGQQGWAALATLNLANGKVSTSDHLRQSSDNFYVVNSTKDRNSWLSISIANVHDTPFCCQVVYSDNGSYKTLRSEAFPFPSNNITYPGITVTVTEGLSIECFFKPQGVTVNGTFFEIVRTGTNRDLCQQQEQWDEQHLQQLCSFRNAFVGGMAVKEAHVFNMSQDEGTYQCRIFDATSEEMVVTNPITTTTYCCAFAIASGILFTIILVVGCIYLYVSCYKKKNMGNTHDSSCCQFLKRQSYSLSEAGNMCQDQSQGAPVVYRVKTSSNFKLPINCTEDQASSSNTEHSPTSVASSDSPPPDHRD